MLGESQQREVVVSAVTVVRHHDVPVLAQTLLPPGQMITDVDEHNCRAKVAAEEVKAGSDIRDGGGGNPELPLEDFMVALPVVDADNSHVPDSFSADKLLVPFHPEASCLFQPRLGLV